MRHNNCQSSIRKSDKQHILDNPDTYVGSVESVEDNLPVYENGKITQRQVNYIPGLFKYLMRQLLMHVIMQKDRKPWL